MKKWYLALAIGYSIMTVLTTCSLLFGLPELTEQALWMTVFDIIVPIGHAGLAISCWIYFAKLRKKELRRGKELA